MSNYGFEPINLGTVKAAGCETVGWPDSEVAPRRWSVHVARIGEAKTLCSRIIPQFKVERAAHPRANLTCVRCLERWYDAAEEKG